MNRYFKLFLCLCLVALAWPALAEESVQQVSYFADPYGNTGSFWKVSYQGKNYRVLKLKSSDREGEADFVFDEASLKEFETRIAELKRSNKKLKSDGFDVLWSHQSGEATVRTLVGRLHGVSVKMVQVTQKKEGSPEREHQVSIDQCYSELTSALNKFKKVRL